MPFSPALAIVELAFSAILSLLLLWLLMPVARRIGLLDHPCGRKDHDAPTAATGGLAMAGAMFLVMGFFTPTSPAIVAFIVAAAMLVLIGMLDDLYDLRWWLRIIAQCAAVLVMIYGGGVRIEHLGKIFGFSSEGLGALSVPFTMFATVGAINAINMCDGVDGLAGGVVLAALCMLEAAAVYSGNAILAERVVVIAGAVLGFLVVNMRFPWQPRARVFMGNAGSALLGFTIAWVSFRLTQDHEHPVTPILAPWLIATPLIDCLVLIVRRRMRGQSPFRADREHMHHLMLDGGFTPGQLAATMIGTNLMLGLAASLALRAKVPQPVLVLAFVALGVAYFWMTANRQRAVRAFAALNRLLHFKPKSSLLPSSPGGDE